MNEILKEFIENWKFNTWGDKIILVAFIIICLIAVTLLSGLVLAFVSYFNEPTIRKQIVHQEPQLQMQVEIGGKMRTVHRVEINGEDYYFIKGFSIVKCK